MIFPHCNTHASQPHEFKITNAFLYGNRSEHALLIFATARATTSSGTYMATTPPRITISAGSARGRRADTSEDVSRWHRELPTLKEAVRQNHVDGIGRLH